MAGQVTNAQHKYFDIPMTGKMVYGINPLLLGEGDFADLINYRYNEKGIETVGCNATKNATPIGYTAISNGFNFRKFTVAENYTFLQGVSAGNSKVYYAADTPNYTASTLTFSDFITLANNNTCYFSNAPDQHMVICNGNVNYYWSGDEYRVGKVVNWASSPAQEYDYTTVVNNQINDDPNCMTLHNVTYSGIDSYTSVLLHYNASGGVLVTTDSGLTPKTTYAGPGGFPTLSLDYQLGTGAATHTHAGQHGLYVGDHADFDFSDEAAGTAGDVTIECFVNPNGSITNAIPLFYRTKHIHSYTFNNGASQPALGTAVKGATSGSTAVIDRITTSGGDWGAGTATGTVYYREESAGFANPEEVKNLGLSVRYFDINSAVTSVGDIYTIFYITTGGALRLTQTDYGAGSYAIDIYTANGVVAGTDSWNYVALVGDGTNYFMLHGGAAGGAYSVVLAPTAGASFQAYSSAVMVGYSSTWFGNKDIDEYRISKVNRYPATSGFSPSAEFSSAYSTVSDVYVGTIKPLSGVKFYIRTANPVAAGTCVPEYWDGNSWSQCTTVVDGTAVASKTLKQTGTISFDATDSVAYPAYMMDSYGYWYRFRFFDIGTGTKVYFMTVKAAVQSIKDIWDGVGRTCLSAFKSTSGALASVTSNIMSEDYVSTSALTYLSLDSMPNTDFLYLGFSERMTGLQFVVAENNTSANTNMIVQYWNGSAWTTVGPLVDNTAAVNTSLNRTGAVSWNPPGTAEEFKYSIGGDAFYFYKVMWASTLDASVRIDSITGIPAQKQLGLYRFPVMAQNRLWLFNNTSEKKNSFICSSYGTTSVFNGSDSWETSVGSDTDIVAAAGFFSRYANSIYENIVLCKRDSTYLIDGYSSATFKLYTISATEGCIAPQSMVVCDLGHQAQTGNPRHVVMWVASSGVVIFDGSSIQIVSDDIYNVLTSSTAPSARAWFDSRFMEYHLIVNSGEYVYNLKYKKWSRMNRSLTGGFTAMDANGFKYSYGTMANGYVVATDANYSSSISSYIYTGFIPLAKSMMLETKLRYLKFVYTPVATSGSYVSSFRFGAYRNGDWGWGTEYHDTLKYIIAPPLMQDPDAQYAAGQIPEGTFWSNESTLAGATGFKYYLGETWSVNLIGNTFSFYLQAATVGKFSPLMISGIYEIVREDIL